MATASDNSTEPTTASSPPNFTLLIDPPNCGWERSSAGLIYCLQSIANLMRKTYVWDVPNHELATLCQAIQAPLLLITDELTERMDNPPGIEELIREFNWDSDSEDTDLKAAAASGKEGAA